MTSDYFVKTATRAVRTNGYDSKHCAVYLLHGRFDFPGGLIY